MFDTHEQAQPEPPHDLESRPEVIEREAEAALASALQNSDTAAEMLSDSAHGDEDAQTGGRRVLLGLVGLVFTASGVLAMRRLRGRRNG